MSYALVENGVVTQIGLPQTGILKDGSSVSGYNLLEVEILLEEGWLPLVDVVPTYNVETQVVSQDGYTVEAGQVIQNYKIEDKVILPPVVPLEIQIAQLKESNLDTMSALADVFEMVLALQP
jgi:hypothetical protein